MGSCVDTFFSDYLLLTDYLLACLLATIAIRETIRYDTYCVLCTTSSTTGEP